MTDLVHVLVWDRGHEVEVFESRANLIAFVTQKRIKHYSIHARKPWRTDPADKVTPVLNVGSPNPLAVDPIHLCGTADPVLGNRCTQPAGHSGLHISQRRSSTTRWSA